MKTFITGVLLLISGIGFSQKNNVDSTYFVNMKSNIISLQSISVDSIYDLPFNHVRVLDVRPDTTCVGFIKFSNTDKLIFAKDFSSAFAEYIHQHYNTSKDSNDLLIVTKEFRITNYAHINGISNQNVTQWSGGCMINVELYLNNNSDYHALYKIDSLLIELSAKESAAYLIAESFRTILKKSENKNLSITRS